jgi:hypothetical protein
MQGDQFINTGKVEVPVFYFNRGGGAHTYVSGSGEWTHAVDVRIENDTLVKPTSPITFKTWAFTVGLSGTGSALDLNGGGCLIGRLRRAGESQPH